MTVKPASPDSALSEPYHARIALISVPLGVLKAGPPRFTPPLPPRRIRSIDALGMGVLNKVILTYAEPWWPDDAGFTFLLDPEDPTNLSGPAPAPTSRPRSAFIINLWKATGVPALSWFFGGDSADQLEESSDAEISAWAGKAVEQYLGPTYGGGGGSAPPPPPTRVIVTRWRGDPYSQGSYAYFPVRGGVSKEVSVDGGASSHHHPAASFSDLGGSPLDCVELARPLWNRFFFAGEHTEPDHFASVHGAYLSGVREALKIEDALVALQESRV